jgi:hypothetical protein
VELLCGCARSFGKGTLEGTRTTAITQAHVRAFVQDRDGTLKWQREALQTNSRAVTSASTDRLLRKFADNTLNETQNEIATLVVLNCIGSQSRYEYVYAAVLAEWYRCMHLTPIVSVQLHPPHVALHHLRL